MNHTSFEKFARDCEQVCAKYLHKDFDGNPSFDGDQEENGYSLDTLYIHWEDGMAEPDDIQAMLRMNGRI